MNDVKGIAIGHDSKSPFFYRDIRYYRLRAIDDERIHEDFLKGKKKLTPVIFSHGLRSNRAGYVSIASYLASYGCIVYCMTHSDMSAMYYQDMTKSPPEDVFYKEYDPEVQKETQEEFRQKQLEIRIKDVSQTLEFIKEQELNKIKSIDMSKLVALGHSMGGITALEMAYQLDEEFKICAALDPWYFPKSDIVFNDENYGLKQPLCLILSDTFHKHFRNSTYDYLVANNKFFENSIAKSNDDKSYNLIVKNSVHKNQQDIPLYYNMMYKLIGEMPMGQDHEAKYIENIELICAFLDEHEFLPAKCGNKVKDILQDG